MESMDREQAPQTALDALSANNDLTDADRKALQMVAAAARADDQHDVLGAMVGEWDVTGRWGIGANDPVAVHSQSRNEWELFGQFVRCAMLADGSDVVVNTATYGFDTRVDQYFCFAINALTPFYDLERGDFHAGTGTLVLAGVEQLRPGVDLAYRRTVTFVDADRFTIEIDYPNPAPGLGGMWLQYRRA